MRDIYGSTVIYCPNCGGHTDGEPRSCKYDACAAIIIDRIREAM